MYEKHDSYEVGDRVILVIDHPDRNQSLVAGMTGTVCANYRTERGWVPVNWDSEIERGHNCSSSCPSGHGWNTHPDYLEMLALSGDDEINASGESDMMDFLCL